MGLKGCYGRIDWTETMSGPRTIEQIRDLMKMPSLHGEKVIDFFLELNFLTKSKEADVNIKEVERVLADLYERKEVPPEVYNFLRGAIFGAKERAKYRR